MSRQDGSTIPLGMASLVPTGGINHEYSFDYTFNRGGVALALILGAIPAHAWDGRAQLECDTCASVTDFKNTARSWALQQNLAVGNYGVLVVNPESQLTGKIGIVRMYDSESHTWNTVAIAQTRSVADMQQEWRVSAPEDLANIPVSVAGTYTGSAQSQTISAYLHNYFSGQTIALDETALVLFNDGTRAVYQLVDAPSQTWNFVSGTGEDANNNPLDDAGQPLNPPPGGPPLTPPLNIHIQDPAQGKMGPTMVEATSQTAYEKWLTQVCNAVACYTVGG